MVLMRKQPGTAKGMVFVSIEDEFGDANPVVYAQVGAQYRKALLGGRLLVAEGRGEEHAEVPTTHLIVRSLTDRSDLLDGLG
jgi:error-prone DNA polymerase